MNLLRLFPSVLCLARDLVVDTLGFAPSSFRSRTALIAENLFLRKQLTFYQEHQVRPRRLTNAARLSLVFWSRFFPWKSALLMVKPATLIGWHRKAFRLFWQWKSRRVGRPRLRAELRQMIRRMVHDNPTWGEERIADELWLKSLASAFRRGRFERTGPRRTIRAIRVWLRRTGRRLSAIMPESYWHATSWWRSPLASVSYICSW